MRNFESPISFQPGEIAAYFVNVDRPQRELIGFASALSPEEKARAKRFRILSDSNRYVVMHGALRLILAGYVGCDPGQVDIRTDVNGKPYLKSNDKAAIHFSVSRSDAFAALAFSQIGEIGVDIEKIRPIPDMLEIVDQHFTSIEKREIYSCPENKRFELFYKLWTRKEAVLKAQGMGLLKPLDSVDVSSVDDSYKPRMVQVTEGNTSEGFSVIDIKGPVGYATALAVAGPITDISVKQIDDALVPCVDLFGGRPPAAYRGS